MKRQPRHVFNIVEYAVQTMIKGNSLSTAAKRTAEKFSGSENMFLGPGIIEIDAEELEEDLWNRMVEFTINALGKIKEGKEHYALGGAVHHFNQGRFKKFRPELKERVILELGYDPFTSDDGT